MEAISDSAKAVIDRLSYTLEGLPPGLAELASGDLAIPSTESGARVGHPG
jgi:hypothetical protein